VSAFVALGGNIGDSAARLRAAMEGIDRLPVTRVGRRSALYESVPMGVIKQPLFVNAVARIETRLSPEALLAELQKLERRFGRVRKLRWGPRTLDLDILVYGDSILDHADLIVPHPGIPDRAFVLYPLREIAPGLPVPGMGTPAELIRRCPGPVPVRLR
jgi:2-amino-4-hydroxy-6-hydroxymethyldihydropteridine diphosphokinase